VTGAVGQFFGAAAQQSGQTLTTEDLVPFEDSDPSGSAATYLALGVILGGFMSGTILSLLPAGSTVRIALGLIMPAVFATGMVIYGGAVFGIPSAGGIPHVGRHFRTTRTTERPGSEDPGRSAVLCASALRLR